MPAASDRELVGLAALIDTYRRRWGLSYRALAERTGLSHQYLWWVVNTPPPVHPHPATLDAIATRLDLPYEDVLAAATTSAGYDTVLPRAPDPTSEHEQAVQRIARRVELLNAREQAVIWDVVESMLAAHARSADAACEEAPHCVSAHADTLEDNRD